jgi:hypothetical protein
MMSAIMKLLHLLTQSDRKVTRPIPDTCSICQKINYIEIRKQKKNVILSAGNLHRVQRCICRFLWHRIIGKCIPKLILAV